MRKLFFISSLILFILISESFSQQLVFNHILSAQNGGGFNSIAQDKYGVIWFTRYLEGLQRFDGSELKTYLHDPYNTNSVANNFIECMSIDENNIFWLGTNGSGLDRFDPSTNTFTHFRHDNKNPASLANDVITALLSDRSGNLWIGSDSGMDMLNKKTGRFIHYQHDPKDPESLSFNEVRTIYEDHEGKIWIGCGRPFLNFYQKPEDGGLNCLNKATGKFKRYMHDPANPNSISNNKVRAIFEDSKGNFWIGTRGDGLHTLDRKTGVFTHHYYDPLHPDKLSRPPQIFEDGEAVDHIAFITEDPKGGILIGTHAQGINYYTPSTGKVIHYGYLIDKDLNLISADTATGLSGSRLWRAFTSKEGLIWITSLGSESAVYTINPFQTYLPFYTLNERKPDINSLYCEPNNTILWIGTGEGLFRKNLKTGEQKIIKHNPSNANSLCNDTVTSVKVDNDGKLWIGTYHGLCGYDPVSNKFSNYYHDNKNPNSLSSNNIAYLFFDSEKKLWIGTFSTGVDKLDIKTGAFKNYRYDDKNRNSISNDLISGITEDKNDNIWIATGYGLNSLNKKTTAVRHYFGNSVIAGVLTDSSGVVWTAINNGVYFFDKKHNEFQAYTDSNLNERLTGVINIIEDKNKNLWLSASNQIIKINAKRNAVKIYDSTNGVHLNSFAFADNYVSNSGEIFIGDQDGFYAFYPKDVEDKTAKPAINFTSFKINDVEAKVDSIKGLTKPISEAGEIKLNYKQNNFSFEFGAISYAVIGAFKFLYKLENYDKNWHYLGSEHKVYFFNLEPGKYVLHIKAVRKDGVTGEKEIAIIISPPWYRTWWAYTMYIICFLILSFFVNRIIRNRIIEKERQKSREKELQQAKEIERAYNELKSTQAQLIQSEKMASLGELTAGIAHEIQNPLNFVNNFSEVSNELIEEMNMEIDKGNNDEVKAIANDIKQNLEKINHHGKRADAIVKGMLQHSSSHSGIKEPTNINKLADEYLRLAYHGLKAKDKTFNATVKTDFDETLEKVNIIPQDIGRVMLNLINNAFYAVNEKKQQQPEGYEPTVSVSTKRIGDKVEISVRDNGNGIPQKVVDKIFQPFFTTKPTGQGTGLGLSLAYDIVKAHGGELKVDTKENQEAAFIIILPI